MSPIHLRPPTPADAAACGRIIHEAFSGIANRHGFPPDFPSVESAIGLAEAVIANPAAFAVVAERDGKIVGSNFLDQRNAIAGVGPITVDPAHQGTGVGRRLMQAVLERGRSAAGIRLVQEPFNTVSLPLYASLGFEVKEPLAVMRGKPAGRPGGPGEGRPMQEADLPVCAELCQRVHGFDRANELRDSLKAFRPFVFLRDGRIVAYTSAPTFWLLNHGVAETEPDMFDLLCAATAANQDPIAFLVPIRRASFFRWCIAAGLRVVKPMTLMAIGAYQEPQGCFFPSVIY